MFLFRKKRRNSGSMVHREGEVLVYNSLGSGSSSSSSSSSNTDEERGFTSAMNTESGAFPTAERTRVPTIAAQVDAPTRRVPDPWSADEIQDGNNPPLPEDEQQGAVDEHLPTPQQAELLEAWMTKRKAQRLEQQHQRIQSMMDPRTGGFQQASVAPTSTSTQQPTWFVHQQQQQQHQQQYRHPVDVDTGVEVIEKYDASHVYDIPTALATVIGDDSHTVVSKPGSLSSLPSAATSDMTPIASNKTYRARHRPSQSASLNPSLSATIEGHESGGGSQDNSEGENGCCKQCAVFLDVRTWSGKVAFLLIVILVLAVTTMVVSALLAQQSRSIINNNSDDMGVITRVPTVPTTSTAPSTVPTSATTLAPTGATSSPTAAASPPGVDKTPAPTERGATVTPTVAPTVTPTTLAPTTALPTSSPSLEPTTLLPTSVPPTGAPTTLQPTFFPTIAPSTATPTLEPLENLLLAPGDAVDGPSTDAAFGSSIALSGDGRVMVVGSPEYQSRNGRVDVYALIEFPGAPEPWQWVQRDVKLGDVLQGTLGQSVAVSFDGTIFAVSEPGVERRAGRVTVYAYNPSSRSYFPLGSEIAGAAPASYSGTSIALSADGYRIAVGAPYFSGVNDVRLHGQVVVYELSGNEWLPMGNPISGAGRLDWLGSALDLSDDGLRVVASAPRNDDLSGYVGTWEWSASLRDWVPWGTGDLFNEVVPAMSGDRFGHSIALSTTPEGIYRVAVGVPWKSVDGKRNAGITLVFELDPIGNRWVQIGEPIGQNPPEAGTELGSAVDLLDGRFLLVGIPGAANGAGEVRLYRFDELQKIWEEHPVSLQGATSGDDFGVALAAQREVEINRQGISLVVGAVSRGDIGYVQSFMEE